MVKGGGTQRTETPAAVTFMSLPSLMTLACCMLLPSAFMNNYVSAEKESFLQKTQGESAMLHAEQDFGSETQVVEWNYLTKNVKLQLLKSQPSKSKPIWINTQEKYKGRLSLEGVKTLKIIDLTSKDTGCYEAQIKSVSGKIITQKFMLTVSGDNMRTCSWWLLLGSLILLAMLL